MAKIKNNVEAANKHASNLKVSKLSFSPKHQFSYSKSTATGQLNSAISGLMTVVSDFSSLVSQNSEDIKSVAKANKDFDDSTKKSWDK